MQNKDTSVLLIHQQKHVGGGQTYVNELVHAFRKKGLKVELIEDSSTFKIVRKLLTSKARYIIWSVYYEFSIIPLLLSFLLGKKNAIIVYGIWKLESRSLFIDDSRAGTRFDQENFELKLLIKQFFFITCSTYILHLSLYAKRLFDSVGLFRLTVNKKHLIIYGGVNKKVFKRLSLKEKLTLRKKLGIPKESTILLMVGRIEKRKNYPRGVEILKKIRTLIPKKNVLLYLVLSYGEFNEFRYLNLLFKEVSKLGMGEYVRIVTGVSQKKVAKFYQASDVYLMLSEELETFGLVTLEALSSGLPVYGYTACATTEIISNKNSKTLFPSGDKEKISKGIVEYLKSPMRKKIKLVDSLVSHTSKFSWENSVKTILKSLE